MQALLDRHVVSVYVVSSMAKLANSKMNHNWYHFLQLCFGQTLLNSLVVVENWPILNES